MAIAPFFRVRPSFGSNNFFESPDDQFLTQNQVKFAKLRIIKCFFRAKGSFQKFRNFFWKIFFGESTEI